MILKYEFDNGDVSEVEVTEEQYNMVMESRREESNAERRHRAHCISYDAIDYEGLEYADPDTPETMLEKEALSEKLREALEVLTPTQTRRFLMFAGGLSLREIARRENVSDHKKISKSVEEAQKKIKKIF